jgi:hypothetical protein
MSEQPPDQPDPYAVPTESPAGGRPAESPAPPPPPPPPPVAAAAPPGYPQPAPGYPQVPQQYGYAVPATPTTSGRAIAVMVLGIVGIVMVCAYGIGLVCAIVALSLAPGAKREIRASNGWKTGEGMVKAGVICSWITVGLGLLFAAFIVVGLVLSAASSTVSG